MTTGENGRNVYFFAHVHINPELMCTRSGENGPATAAFAQIKINLGIDVQQQQQKCRSSACVCTECKSI
jgi:hypothetical protein